MNYYIKVLQNYSVFSGRARRAEYWWFNLFSLIASILLGVVDAAMGTFNAATGIGVLGAAYSLIVLIPTFAVTVRRLHDTGRSAWWLLLFLLPVLGVLILLVFMVLGSEEGENRYGPNPIDTSAAA